MTLEDLRKTLEYAGYPKTYYVDRATIELAEEAVLEHHRSRGWGPFVWAGPNGGTLFKGVELLVR